MDAPTYLKTKNGSSTTERKDPPDPSRIKWLESLKKGEKSLWYGPFPLRASQKLSAKHPYTPGWTKPLFKIFKTSRVPKSRLFSKRILFSNTTVGFCTDSLPVLPAPIWARYTRIFDVLQPRIVDIAFAGVRAPPSLDTVDYNPHLKSQLAQRKWIFTPFWTKFCSRYTRISGDPPSGTVWQRFRGGLVFKAHRLWVSLNSRLEIDKEEGARVALGRPGPEKAVPVSLPRPPPNLSSSLLHSSLDLSDTRVYEPSVRALLEPHTPTPQPGGGVYSHDPVPSTLTLLLLYYSQP